MAIFPSLSLDNIISSINNETEETTNNIIEDVVLLTFKNKKATVVLENGKPVTTTDLQTKIQMYLNVLLRTKLDEFEIYENTNFGMTYFRWIGQKVPEGILISELEREISEHLSKMNVFDHVENFDVKVTGPDFKVNFDLILISGETLSMEVI